MPSKLSVLRVGFFLDGYTLKKVNEYYLKHHKYHSRLDFRALKGWVRDYAMKLLGREGCPVEVEAHYYHPYVRHLDKAESSFGDGQDRLEKQLTLAGFEVHYNAAKDVDKMGPNMQLVEDAYLYAYYHKIDVLVLLSTQGQYSTLPERLKREGVPKRWLRCIRPNVPLKRICSCCRIIRNQKIQISGKRICRRSWPRLMNRLRIRRKLAMGKTDTEKAPRWRGSVSNFCLD